MRLIYSFWQCEKWRSVVSVVLLLLALYLHLTGASAEAMAKVGASVGRILMISRSGPVWLTGLSAVVLPGRVFFSFCAIGFVALAAVEFIAVHVGIRCCLLGYGEIYCMLIAAWLLKAFWNKSGSGQIGILVAIRDVVLESYLILRPISIALHYAEGIRDFPFPLCSYFRLGVDIACVAFFIALSCGVLLRSRLSATLVARIAISFVWGVALIPMFATESGAFAYDSNLGLRLVFLVFFTGIVTWLSSRFRFVVLLYVFITFATQLLMIFFSGSQTCESTNRIHDSKSVLRDVCCVRKNNLFILLYDAYPATCMLNVLGIENSSLCEFLENYGFTVYPNVYSEGNHTLSSMDAMFSIGGVRVGSVRSSLAGNNVFCAMLNRAGYDMSFLSCGYCMPMRGECMPGDFYFPTPARVVRPERVVENCILMGYLSQSPQVFNDFSSDEWCRVKKDVLLSQKQELMFVYAHQDLPGHCALEVSKRGSQAVELEKFKAQLKKANHQIREDVQLVVNQYKDAIVIVAGDHGAAILDPRNESFSTSAFVLDRFGTFLSVRWPDGYQTTRQIVCLQDLLYEVVRCLTGVSVGRADGITHDASDWGAHGIPDGYVKDGKVQNGPDGGLSIFDAGVQSIRKALLK